MSDYKNLYDAWQETKRQLTEAEGKLLAIVSALEIDESAVNLEAGQLKLIVEAVVKQAKQLTEPREEASRLSDAYNTLECDHFDAVKRAEKAETERDLERSTKELAYEEVNYLKEENKRLQKRIEKLEQELMEANADLH